MKNPLNRRLPRELKGEMGKYMVIFLFMMLTIGFTSGYFVANSSMLQASEESYDKYNIEDGHFVVKDEISASLQRKLEQEDVKIYKDFYKEEAVDTDNDGKSDGSIRVFAEREKVNLICVMKGSMPKGKAEIAVDRMYADNNDIAVGDTICIGNSKKKVSGYVALSDYSALFSDNSDMMFDATKFGVAVMTKQGYDSLAKEHENYQYDWKYNTAPKDKKQEQKQSEDFINAFAAFLLQKDSVCMEKSGASYNGEKIFDFAADSELIFASFLAAYGLDLTKEHMHWFKFMALLKPLSPDSPLMRTVRLRQTDTSEIEDDKLRRQIRRAKNAVRIKEKERNDEQWTAL